LLLLKVLLLLLLLLLLRVPRVTCHAMQWRR
jgi:hypothetical protein